MSSLKMRRCAAADSDLAWLADRTSNNELTGYDAAGWPASVWILHAMYERPAEGPVPSADDVWQQRLADGTAIVQPSLECLLDGAVATGVTVGYAERPGPPWRRLRWQELAERTGVEVTGHRRPPSARWFPYRSWPVGLQPPCEGSLDGESLARLVDLLAAHSPEGRQTRCFAYYAPLVTNDFDATEVYHGPLAALASLVGPDTDLSSTPSNVWPEDHSWLVYTDWDLCSTRLSGQSALVSAVRSDAVLETIPWPV